MTRDSETGFRQRMAAWYGSHRRAVNAAVIASVVVLFAIAAGLGWALTRRPATVGVDGGPSPSATSSSTPLATESPDPTASASVPPAATASATPLPATPEPTPDPTAAAGTIMELFGVDEPSGFQSTITCEGSIGESDPVAIVWLHQADQTVLGGPVLRNYADVTAPRTSCVFGSGDYWIHSLVDARHLVINGMDGGLYAIVELPEVRYHWFRLPTGQFESGQLYAVAPDLRSVTWWHVWTEGAPGREAILSDAAGRHVLGKLPELLDGRCGSPLDSSQGAFSRSGEWFYVLDQLMPNLNVLLAGRGAETQLMVVPPEDGWPEGAYPLMALWAPTSDTLYYRLGADVMRWRAGSEPEVFLADTPWSHPTFTPDGRYLAYATEDGVFLLDMTAGTAPQLISGGASQPIFLNGSQLWFKVAGPDGCVSDLVANRVYDLNDRIEAPSIIDMVLAVWPATSSQSR